MENYFGNIPSVSYSLDPDQARHSVGPDLGPNCLQRLSADGTRRQRVLTPSLCFCVNCNEAETSHLSKL